MSIFQDTKAGQECTFAALVESLQKRFTANNSTYYAATLFDGEISADARIWNCSLIESQDIKTGEVYEFHASFKEFAGKLQLTISTINPLSADCDTSKFIKQAPMKLDQMKEELNYFLNKITNTTLSELVKAVYEKIKDKFYLYPAAMSMHHNYQSGLLYHTLSMLKLAEKMGEVYPALNMDLLYAGIMLHDVGKTKELSGIKAPIYTKEGNLLGHIVMGLTMISDTANELHIQDTEEVEMILHLIASHHGELEYGSPKEPMIMEAYALHLIDLTDSKMAAILPEVEKTEKGGQTATINSLNRKSLYVPKL